MENPSATRAELAAAQAELQAAEASGTQTEDEIKTLRMRVLALTKQVRGVSLPSQMRRPEGPGV